MDKEDVAGRNRMTVQEKAEEVFDGKETQPLFRAESRMDYAEYERFNLFVMKHNRPMWMKAVPFMLGVVLCAAIVETILQGQFIAAVILAAFLAWYCWDKATLRSAKKHFRRTYESNKLIQNVVGRYSFYAGHFETKTPESAESIAYDKLYEVLESDTNFYLMIARNQGMVLSKENCSAGLQEFLRKLRPAAKGSEKR